MRKAARHQMGKTREFSRLHRISRMHLYAGTDRRPAGYRWGGSRRTGGRRVLPELRSDDGIEKRQVWDVLRLLRVSGLQDHQADWRGPEEGGRRPRRKMPAVRQ